MSGINPICKASIGVFLMEQDKFESEDSGALNGVYADCFRIGHSAYKFVLDFGQEGPEKPTAIFHTRIVMGPDDAKVFLDTFKEAVRQYEGQFGRIKCDC
jgi:hypothetical protein